MGTATRPAAEHAAGCGYEPPEEGTACHFPTPTTPSSTGPRPLLSLRRASPRLVVALLSSCVALYTRKHRRLVGLTERVPPRCAGATSSCRTSTTSTPCTRGSSCTPSPTRSPRPRTGSTRTSSTASSTAPGELGKRFGQWTYRNLDQAPRRRRRQRVRLPRRGDRQGLRPCSPARSTSTARCSSARPPSEPSCS